MTVVAKKLSSFNIITPPRIACKKKRRVPCLWRRWDIRNHTWSGSTPVAILENPGFLLAQGGIVPIYTHIGTHIGRVARRGCLEKKRAWQNSSSPLACCGRSKAPKSMDDWFSFRQPFSTSSGGGVPMAWQCWWCRWKPNSHWNSPNASQKIFRRYLSRLWMWLIFLGILHNAFGLPCNKFLSGTTNWSQTPWKTWWPLNLDVSDCKLRRISAFNFGSLKKKHIMETGLSAAGYIGAIVFAREALGGCWHGPDAAQ